MLTRRAAILVPAAAARKEHEDRVMEIVTLGHPAGRALGSDSAGGMSKSGERHGGL
jgi:hypothetical protein